MKRLAAIGGACVLFAGGALAAMADDGTPGVTTTDTTTTTVPATTTDATTTDSATTTTMTTTVATTTAATTTTTAAPPPTTTTTWTWPTITFRLPRPRAKPPTPTTTSSRTTPAPTTTSALPPPPPPAHLVVTSSVTPSAGATIGSTVDYTFSIANTGGQSVSATLADALPAQVISIESDSDHGSCAGTQSVVCSLGSIGAGQTATVTFATQVGQVGAFDDSATVTPSASGVTVVQSSPLHVTAAAATPVRFAPVKQPKHSARK